MSQLYLLPRPWWERFTERKFLVAIITAIGGIVAGATGRVEWSPELIAGIAAPLLAWMGLEGLLDWRRTASPAASTDTDLPYDLWVQAWVDAGRPERPSTDHEIRGAVVVAHRVAGLPDPDRGTQDWWFEWFRGNRGGESLDKRTYSDAVRALRQQV